MAKKPSTVQGRTVVPFRIRDMADGDKVASGNVTISDQGIFIHIDGHGDKVMEDDASQPIMVEQYDGQVRVVVWSDINQEDPTDTINMDGARVERREDDDKC